jgi:hypothetical protein
MPLTCRFPSWDMLKCAPEPGPAKSIGSVWLVAQAMTVVEYKGYRVEVSSVGKGWRASIFAPGSTRALADSPSNLEKSRSEDIVAEAKRIIDARFGPRSL